MYIHTHIYIYIYMQGAGALSPGHRRTRIGLWNPYVTLCHPPPGDCFRLSASGIPEQPLGITSDYIEFPLHPPLGCCISIRFPCDSMYFPFDPGVVPVGFPDGFLHGPHTYVYTYIYICAGCWVPVPRAPQDQDRLMEPLHHLMPPSTGWLFF